MELVLYVIAAIALSVGALVACLIMLPKWVAGSFQHGDACDCNTCMRRRMSKWDRLNDQRNAPKDVVPMRNTTELVSTRRLSTNDIVTSADTGQLGKRYTVQDIAIRPYGWVVILASLKTGTVSWVRIGNDRLDIPLWRRFQKHRRGHVTGL